MAGLLLAPAMRSDLIFSREGLAQRGGCVDIGNVGGCPLLCARINGQEGRLVFDTGAVLGYLSPNLTRDQEAVGHFHDFHPLHGMHWQTPVYSMNVELGDITVNCGFGNLPEELMSLMEFFGIDGVIGSEVLLRYRIHFNGPDAQLHLIPLG